MGDVNTHTECTWARVVISLLMGCTGYLEETHTCGIFHLYPGRIFQCFTLGSSKGNSLVP